MKHSVQAELSFGSFGGTLKRTQDLQKLKFPQLSQFKLDFVPFDDYQLTLCMLGYYLRHYKLIPKFSKPV